MAVIDLTDAVALLTRSYQGDTDVTGEVMVGRLLQTGMF